MTPAHHQGEYKETILATSGASTAWLHHAYKAGHPGKARRGIASPCPSSAFVPVHSTGYVAEYS